MNYPLVALFCNVKGARWYGKWHLNANVEWQKSIGAPWNTADEAYAAALATGAYRVREGGSKITHLDQI